MLTKTKQEFTNVYYDWFVVCSIESIGNIGFVWCIESVVWLSLRVIWYQDKITFYTFEFQHLDNHPSYFEWIYVVKGHESTWTTISTILLLKEHLQIDLNHIILLPTLYTLSLTHHFAVSIFHEESIWIQLDDSFSNLIFLLSSIVARFLFHLLRTLESI